MSNTEPTAHHQQIADQLSATLEQRVTDAEQYEVLSERGGKLLDVAFEADGSMFVRRRFTHIGVLDIERGSLDFTEAWQAMQDLYTAAGISVVDTTVAWFRPDSEEDFSAAMVSEWAPGRNIFHATTEQKVELASKLPKLFPGINGVSIGIESVQPDMFSLVDKRGEERITLIDVDPNMRRLRYTQTDAYLGAYIERFSQLLWDVWCKDEEKQEVMVAFMIALGDVGEVIEQVETNLMGKTGTAFMDAHFMSQGFDPRESGLSLRK